MAETKTMAIADVVESLANGDESPLREYLSGLDVDVAQLRGLPRWNSAAGVVPRQRETDRRPIEVALSAALTAAGPHPAGAALLALYVRFECEQAWEVSYYYDPIWETLRSLDRLWQQARTQWPAGPDQDAMDAVLFALRQLDAEIATENEQTCGALDRQAVAVKAALAAAGRVVEAAATVADTYPEIADFLIGEAQVRQRYWTGFVAALDATHEALRGSAPLLSDGIEALRTAESEPELSDQDRSELRAHRFSLQALAARIDSDWLTLDHANLLYLYPFGLRGVDALDAVAQVRDRAATWTLSGISPGEVRETLDLDNVWAGSDFLGRRFEGAAIVLPTVTLCHAGGGIATLVAELRFSDLGNHYLRLEAHLHNAGPQETHFAMFRAAPEHGTIEVRCGDRVWPRLSSFAFDLVSALTDRFTPRRGFAEQPGREVAVSVRPGMYHVLLTVRDASIGPGPAAPATLRRPARDGDDVVAAVGGVVLLHPVLSSVAAIGEWIRFPDVASRIEGTGRIGDLVARTDNTTLVLMLGSPSWLVGMHETIAEFAASLDGLFAAWFDELAVHHTRIIGLLARIDDGRRGLAELADDVAQLQQEQLRLYDFVANARSVQALIRSPALTASPVDASLLRRLLDAAGFDRVERDFAAKVAELLDDRLGTKLEALALARQHEADRLTVERDQRSRAWMETLIAVITAAGASGVVQVLQAGFDWGATQTVAAAVSIVFLAGVMGWGAWRLARPRRRSGPQTVPGTQSKRD